MTIALTPTAAIETAMHANLAALACRLDTAVTIAVQARAAMGRRRRKEAIGALLPLEEIIPECEALVRTVILLHRAPNVDETTTSTR